MLRVGPARDLDFSPFGFAAKADASGVDLKVPPQRSVRMTRDVLGKLLYYCFLFCCTFYFMVSSFLYSYRVTLASLKGR